jgi:anti-sigma factor RsiW
MYTDGALPPDLAAGVALHAAGCTRCARRIADARRIAAAFAAEPPMRAPTGFTVRVMDSVYRAALSGAPDEQTTLDAAHPAAGMQPARTRTYRRLGLSFMLAATVLTTGLVLPQGFYPAAIRTESVAAGLSRDRPSPVKVALDGAGRTVQSALGKGGLSR